MSGPLAGNRRALCGRFVDQSPTLYRQRLRFLTLAHMLFIADTDPLSTAERMVNGRSGESSRLPLLYFF